MADVSKFMLGGSTGVELDIKDATARESIETIETDLEPTTGEITFDDDVSVTVSLLRKSGNVVGLSTSFSCTDSISGLSWLTIGSVPTNFIPSVIFRTPFITRTNSLKGLFRVNASGEIQIYPFAAFSANEVIDINYTYIL